MSTNSFVQALWTEPWGREYTAAWGSHFFRWEDWFSCSTFFISKGGERVKYLFTHLFALSRAELKPAFLPCASFCVRFAASLFESPAFLQGLSRQN